MRAAAAVLVLAVAGCGEPVPAKHLIPGADPEAGAALIRSAGCAACHSVPGVRGARGMVGPPLDGFGRRSYVAGRLPNTPENLTRWLRDPQAVDPETVMPATGLDAAQARDVAAYLYTLR